MQQSGWTTRRLSVAAALGAVAVIAGGLVFVAKFGGDRAPGDNPFMAFAFGLFVIGMVVFCAAVIALIGTGLSVVAETRGWAPAAAAAFAPLALVWLLYLAGRRRLRDSRGALAAAHRRRRRRLAAALSVS